MFVGCVVDVVNVILIWEYTIVWEVLVFIMICYVHDGVDLSLVMFVCEGCGLWLFSCFGCLLAQVGHYIGVCLLW